MLLNNLALNQKFLFGVEARKQEIVSGVNHYKRGIVEGRRKASIEFARDRSEDLPPVADQDCTLRNCVRVGGLVVQSLLKAKKEPLKMVSFFSALIIFIALILFFFICLRSQGRERCWKLKEAI